MPWSMPAFLPEGDQPVFLRLADAIIHDIRRGRLVAGERLPSSRVLAGELGVHRNTVLASLAELTSQGWIASQPARGMFVASALPAAAPPRRLVRRADLSSGKAQRRGERRAGGARGGRELADDENDHDDATRRTSAGFALPPALFRDEPRDASARRGMLHMDSATPDPRLFPVELLARAWRRTLLRNGRQLLTYDSPQGHPALLRALAAMLRQTRGMACGDDELLTTRGSQMAIDLVARTLLAPGDAVAVEALGYRPAWSALAWAGAELLPVHVDRHGLDVAALGRLAEQRRLRAVYLTPHHHYPTTVTLSPARRMQLMALAQRHRLLVIEDDYDSELHFEGRPVAPLASADPLRHVIYIGTLSKILAPGLRLGFLSASPDVIAQLSQARFVMDRQGDWPMEAAVAELIEEGELQRHVRRMRRECLDRRDALADELHGKLDSSLRFEPPRGGMALWAEVDPELDATAWCEAALAAGLALARPSQWAFSAPPPNALRLAYSELRRPELRRAVEILEKTRGAAKRKKPVGKKRGGR
jgi:GntR family transcriptional regulator / MocR family aminotransferase